MSFIKAFTVTLAVLAIVVLLVALFGALLPAMISAASTELVLGGVLMFMLAIALIAANVYILVVNLRSIK